MEQLTCMPDFTHKLRPMLRYLCVCLFPILFLSYMKAPKSLEKQIESILQNKKAKVGVAVSFDGGKTITIHGKYSYPMLSVFKFPVALTVLDYLSKNKLSLETKLFIPKSDLLQNTYSPLRDKYPEGNLNLSVRELLKYAVSQSDNNACDILIKYVGGIQVIQKYIKQIGVNEMFISATEDDMHQKFENQYLNHTKPAAAVQLMNTFLRKTLFPSEYQDFFEQVLIETSTGTDKIKGQLPPNLIVGHKTGSSDRSKIGLKIADNDLGFIRLPDGRQYTLAIFVMDSMEDNQTNAAIISDISKVIYDYYK